jgi:putative membrane protein
MIVPLVLVTIWSVAVAFINERIHKGEYRSSLSLVNYSQQPVGVNQVLLTVLGFVVGLGLSFRSSTAYERYSEGRKYWTQLVAASQNITRVIWIHTKTRDNEFVKEDLLGKLYDLNLSNCVSC